MNFELITRGMINTAVFVYCYQFISKLKNDPDKKCHKQKWHVLFFTHHAGMCACDCMQQVEQILLGRFFLF